VVRDNENPSSGWIGIDGEGFDDAFVGGERKGGDDAMILETSV
jgi:hypothetical protein